MVNLKAEIIYFKSTTDFEFEFNLNAAVQMRLFTECPSTDRAFFGALSLAVSRSKAIIITTEFGEEIIKKIAGAIGFKTESISSAEYGILSSETDIIISGGVPLVTEDGIYAGLILESGPQSLIIITNDRKTRKQLMSTLVHSYLNDVANAVSTPAPVVTENVAPIIEEVEEIIEEEIVVNEDVVITDTVVEEIIDEVTDDAVVVVEDNGISEDDEVKQIDQLDESVIENNIEEVLDDTPPIITNKSKNVLTTILLIILFILVGFITYSLVIDPIINGMSIKENISHVFGFLFK